MYLQKFIKVVIVYRKWYTWPRNDTFSWQECFNNGRVSNYIDSLEHRCCFTILMLLQPILFTYSRETCIPPQKARLSRQTLQYIVDWLMDLLIPFVQNMFFCRTIRMWHSLRPGVCNLLAFKA